MNPKYSETDVNRPNENAGEKPRPGPLRSDEYKDEPSPRADEDDIAPEDVEPEKGSVPQQPPSGRA